MLRWLLLRGCWMLVTLLGVTFVTFAVLDLAPVDRAQVEAVRRQQAGDFADAAARDQAIVRLRLHYGMLDEATLEPAPLWTRYGRWLANAATLRFAGPREDDGAFWRRLGEAAPVSALLGLLALCVALLAGVALGAWTGMQAGSRRDFVVSQGLFLLAGVPEFLLAMFLLLALGGGGLGWFPSNGLRSHGAEHWTAFAQIVDFAWHLVLPVLVLASGPTVLVARFLRDSVARTADTAFAANLHALGIEPATVRWRLLRNGGAPLATLAGSLLPMLVGGSIVVENLFSLDGLGHLAFRAVQEQDQAMVMAIVVLGSVATLVALTVSDLMHRLVDPRVRLQA
ncbi:MAG: ABC transporter permease [Planctomycetes bacterium]|nr:ABC transporter permease [Planctomycetota bacterium]